METKNILLVDDDRNFLKVLDYQVREQRYRTVLAHSGPEALERIREQSFDLVVTDLRMPGMDGMELIERIHRLDPLIPIIVLTAHGTIDAAVESIKGGAFNFLTKPFEKAEIQQAISNALRMAVLADENRRLAQVVQGKFEFEGMIGSSKSFREVLKLAAQLAAVDTTVLIQGESGTGKEVLARALHYNSPRQKRPFLVVNCGAIPKDLMESELFGYRKGAFTGALSNKKGKFEAADTGTILLDEVGELPLNMQVKLLRVLQEKEIDVLGDPHPRPVDVRILAATNQDLQQRMSEGAFRDDLYYRLSVAPLSIPPLRARREDIPLLAHHFLRIFQEKFGKKTVLDASAIDVLRAYDWPGNVRELENIIERSVVFDLNGTVTAETLPSQLLLPVRSLGKVILHLPEEGFSLEDLERDILQAALERHHWNQTHAARYLGMTRNTLIYRMQKYDLREETRRSPQSA